MPRKRRVGDPAALVRLALASIDQQIAELEQQRAALAGVLRGEGRSPAGTRKGAKRGRKKSAAKATKRPRRKVSAATRKRLSEAATRRWARERGEKPGKSA